MIITMSENGTIINTVPDNIYQGSNNANTIAVVSTIARTNQMMIAFKLPQVATYTTPALMTLAENIDTQTGFNVWTYDIPSSVTEYYGTAEYQIQCITPTGIIIASGAGSFEIERGVPPILPDEPTPTIYQQILENIGSIQADVLNIQTDVEQNTTDIADLKTNAMLKNNFPNLVNYETYNTTTNTSDSDMNLTGEQITRTLGNNTTRMVRRRISNRNTLGITNGEQIIVSDTPSDSATPTRQIEFDIGLNTSNEPVATIQFQENGVIVNNIDLLKIIADPTGYVTLGTEQIITGKKSFEDVDYIELPINLNDYVRLNSLGLSYNTDVGAHYYNISAIGVQIPQSSGLTGAGQTRYGFTYSTNNDVAWENDDPYYWLADTQIHLNGDNIEYTLSSLNEGLGGYAQFTAGMVVCCDKDSTSEVYLAGHLYKCVKTGTTYSMTDITGNFATQQYVQNVISGITSFKTQVVQELPETGESTILYLVPASSPSGNNYYNEYLWVQYPSGSYGFEQVGTTQIDLSNYVDLTSAQTVTGVKTFTNLKASTITNGSAVATLPSESGTLTTEEELSGRVIPEGSYSNWNSTGSSLALVGQQNDLNEPVIISLNNSQTSFAGAIYKEQGTQTNINYKNYYYDQIGFDTNKIRWNFDDVQTQIAGNTLESNLTVSNALNIGKAYLCNATSTSDTYQQGHIYLIGGTSGAYTATDITPSGSTPENVMTTTDYPNLVDLENKIGVSGTETTGATTVSIRNSYLNYRNSLQLTPSDAKLNSSNGSRLMQLDISCGSTEGTDSAKILRSGGNDIDLLNLQPKLTAGEGITINDNNVISASGGSSSGIQSQQVYGSSQLFQTIFNIVQNNQQIVLGIKWETRSEKLTDQVVGNLVSSGTITLNQIQQQLVIGNNEILFLNVGNVGINDIYLSGNYQTNNFSLHIASNNDDVDYYSNTFSLSTQYSNGYFNYYNGNFSTLDDVFTIYYI